MIHKSAPDGDGIRTLVVACVDKQGTRTVWELPITEEGEIAGTLRNAEQDVLSRHCKAVRLTVRRLSRAAVRQQEMFDPARIERRTDDGC